MKHIKKVVTLFLAFAMVLAMSATVFAEPTQTTLKIESPVDGHEYSAYQLFVGDLSEGTLSNVKWGADVADSIKYTVDGTEKTIAPVVGEAVPAEVLTYLEGLENDAKATADIIGSWVKGNGTTVGGENINVPTGYYVIKDKITDPDKEKTDTLSTFICKVVGPTAAAPKSGTTQNDKIIVSDTLGKDEGVNNINDDTDNVSVGDTVNYQITAKIPENAGRYNYFYFVINDKLSTGLTFTEGSIKVYKGSVSEDNLLTENEDYKLAEDPGDYTFQVGMLDAKSLAGQNIIVTYSAVLNENAVIGESSNDNTSTVDFSNDPNHDYDGENNPGFPSEADDDAMGETPESVTKTYTSGIELLKVDQDGNVLTGATFSISGRSTKKVLTVAETFTEDAEGAYWKLKNGTYTKDAPTEEGDYMVKTPGATEGYVVDASYSGDDKVVVDGVTYRPYVPATDEGKDVYVLHHGNAHLYDSTTTKYKKEVSKTVVDATTSHEAEKAVDANGLVRFDGLGEGSYTISETVTPAGYNTLPDLTVNISFAEDGTPHWSISGATADYDQQEGIFKITIENQKGTELPQTGGIGTIIFYVLGSLLVVGCGIVLISRRRMLNK